MFAKSVDIYGASWYIIGVPKIIKQEGNNVILVAIYDGVIKSMCNTPCKIAIYKDENAIKVFQKEFFRNQYGLADWKRNVVLESLKSTGVIEKQLIVSGFVRVR